MGELLETHGIGGRVADRGAARRRRPRPRVARAGAGARRRRVPRRRRLGGDVAHRPLPRRRPARGDRADVRRSSARSRPTRTWTRPTCRRSTSTTALEATLTILRHKLKHTRIKVAARVRRRGPADLRLRLRAQPGLDQPARQRDRRAGRGRDDHALHRVLGGQRRRGADRRRRPGHPGGRPAPRLRPLLHHEGRGRGHRPGARRHAPHRRRPPRRRRSTSPPAREGRRSASASPGRRRRGQTPSRQEGLTPLGGLAQGLKSVLTIPSSFFWKVS